MGRRRGLTNNHQPTEAHQDEMHRPEHSISQLSWLRNTGWRPWGFVQATHSHGGHQGIKNIQSSKPDTNRRESSRAVATAPGDHVPVSHFYLPSCYTLKAHCYWSFTHSN